MTNSKHDSQRSAAAATAVGLRRVVAHGRDVAVAYLFNLLLALPLAAAVQKSIADSVRHREAAERLLHSWDGLWHASFSAQAGGLDASFSAGVVGIGAVFRALDALITGALFELPVPLVVVGLLYFLGWVFLSGGLLRRFSGDERGLFAAGAAVFGRMFWLACIGGLASLLVLGSLLPWLTVLVQHQLHEVIDERIAVAWVLAKYLLVWLLMIEIRVLVDYAKVMVAADPECSTLAALRQSLVFCRARTGAVVGVVVRIGAVGLALLVAYWVIAPSAAQGNPFMILMAFVISQTSVIARVAVRAWGLAASQALVGDAPRASSRD